MIAMQYSLVLPADYDMGLIRRRISERGHLMDGFPGLAFKAYLHAGRRDAPCRSDNLYAPFYLWHTAEGMNAFLCGSGFQGLAQSFGRPAVGTWTVWHGGMAPGMSGARHALRQTAPIAPHADLAALRRSESERSSQLLANGDVLASVAAFEPMSWSLVRFQLWRVMPEPPGEGQVQIYDVGHLSEGGTCNAANAL